LGIAYDFFVHVEHVRFRPKSVALELYLHVVEEASLLGGGKGFQLLFASAKVKEVVPVLDIALDQILQKTVGFAGSSDAEDEVEQAVMRSRSRYVPILRNSLLLMLDILCDRPPIMPCKTAALA
jgi:hypothetical protein